jgi:hypothetical protein
MYPSLNDQAWRRRQKNADAHHRIAQLLGACRNRINYRQTGNCSTEIAAQG